MFHHNYKKCYVLNKFLVKYKKDINNIDRELALYNDQLVSIPTELGQLNMLQKLQLSYNQLVLIPTELGQLNMLQQLCLDNNQLHLVPENINKNIIKIKN